MGAWRGLTGILGSGKGVGGEDEEREVGEEERGAHNVLFC
jgi:hypothetical protein